MSELSFRVTGFSRSRERELRRLSGAGSAAARTWLWLFAGGAALYGIELVLPRIEAVLANRPRVELHGTLFTGHRVVLIQDVSSSMDKFEANLQEQLGKLRSAGMTVDEPLDAMGFGVAVNSSDNLLRQVEEAVKQHVGVDTIYAFSDFEWNPSPFWKSDGEGYAQLQWLLAECRVKLYLGTVNYPPPEELVAIARSSGGNLIESIETEGR